MKNKFLDPIANSKSIGYLYILSGILSIVRLPSIISKGNYDILSMGYNILSIIMSIIVGIGLIKTKLWGLYGLILTIIVGSIYSFFFVLPRGGMFVNIFTIGVIINIVIFLWFFPARNRFNK